MLSDSRDTRSSARDYEAAGYYDRDSNDRGRDDRGGYDRGGYDRGGYDNRSTGYYGGNDWNDRGRSQSYGQRDQGQRDYGRQDRYGSYGDQVRGSNEAYRGSYAHDGHRFTDVEDHGREYRRDYGATDYRGQRSTQNQTYGQNHGQS